MDAKKQMERTLEVFKEELKGMRTNRPSSALLDGVVVELYGSEMRMRDVATVSVAEGTQLVITPFDPNSVGPISKAIEKSNLNLMPAIDGHILRIHIPPMSEEWRKKLVKELKDKGEKSKVVVRELRRKANEEARKQKKEGEITEDDLKGREKRHQEATDWACREIDTLVESKEKEIMEI